MIKVKRIEITRAEGPIHLCGRKETFDNFRDANLHLLWNQSTYTKLGYDKHDVVIEWEDGNTYSLRHDCQHPENKYFKGNEIDKRLKAGVKCSLEHYREYLTRDQIDFLESLKLNYEGVCNG